MTFPLPATATSPHILLYALGNYTHPTTKHSLAQYVIPALLRHFDLGKEGDFLRMERKHDCWIGSGVVKSRTGAGGGGGVGDGWRLSIAKPRLLMNISARPLPFLLRTLSTAYPQHPPAILIALHDNLTLPPLSVGKPRFGVSAQGHGGLLSVEKALGTKDYYRLGLGIGRGGNAVGGGGVQGWVLSELNREERGYWDGDGAGEVGDVLEGLVGRLSLPGAGKGKAGR